MMNTLFELGNFFLLLPQLHLACSLSCRSLRFCSKHCLETGHFQLEFLIVLLELSNILLFIFKLCQYLLGNSSSQSALQCNRCLDYEPEFVILFPHTMLGLDLDGCQFSSCGMSTVKPLQQYNTKLCPSETTSNNEHTKVIRKKLPSNIFTQFPPPFPSFASTVKSLDIQHSLGRDQKPHPLLQSTNPCLQNSRRRRLVKYPMRFQCIMSRFSHEHLILSQLYIRLGEYHGNGTQLQSTYFFKPSNPLLIGILGTSIMILLPLYQ
mmetsp:Transcript_11474/g.17428  ORF Transcript_11474/g.17428 Transcript_11474/m.17428 type:complete len:265 (+) Transcript_11474:2957-3751(+)